MISLPSLISHDEDLTKRCLFLKDSCRIKLLQQTLITLPTFTNTILFLCPIFDLLAALLALRILLMPENWRGRFKSKLGVEESI